MESQTPTLPDPSALKDLSPSVAITFLIAVVVVSLLVYFGGPIRDRLKRRSDPDEPRRTTSPSGSGPAPSTAVDIAEKRTEQFIDNLLRQVEDCANENDRLERRAEEDVRRRDRRIEDLERQNQLLREENQQLRMQVMWQRGPHQ